MRFTDAHSGAALCTPTRYGILTGRHSWRSTLRSGVLNGPSPRLIEPGRLTVAEFLRRNGYRTACIGKWHLGMTWPRKDGAPAGPIQTGWEVDYARPVADDPPEDAAEDSVSLVPALLGTATGPDREAAVHLSGNGSFAIRQGKWKLALCPDSGGWSAPRPGRDSVDGLPRSNSTTSRPTAPNGATSRPTTPTWWPG